MSQRKLSVKFRRGLRDIAQLLTVFAFVVSIGCLFIFFLITFPIWYLWDKCTHKGYKAKDRELDADPGSSRMGGFSLP
jgi:hypothetical protein